MTYHEALKVVRSLNMDDLARLVQTVLEEDMDGNYPPLSEAWKAELDRRIADDDANPDDGVAWEQVKAEAGSLTSSQEAELDRRLAEHEANPNDVVPWEQVEAATRARLQP